MKGRYEGKRDRERREMGERAERGGERDRQRRERRERERESESERERERGLSFLSFRFFILALYFLPHLSFSIQAMTPNEFCMTNGGAALEPFFLKPPRGRLKGRPITSVCSKPPGGRLCRGGVVLDRFRMCLEREKNGMEQEGEKNGRVTTKRRREQ